MIFPPSTSVDFDQIDEAYIQPSYLISLIHLELTPSDFLDTLNNEISNRSDAIEVNIPQDAGLLLANHFHNGFEGDVFIMPFVLFGRGSENGLGQSVGQLQTIGQLMSANGAVLAVGLPS